MEREHLARVGIERDRASLERVPEQRRGEPLEIEIDTGVERIGRYGGDVRSRASIANHTAARVDFDESGPFPSAQAVLVFAFQAALADLLPSLVAAVGA